jgi:ribosomal protein L11 methyltransferase
MSYTAVHILCNEDLEETVSFLLQESGFDGTSYEKGRLIAYCNSESYNEHAMNKVLDQFELVAKLVVLEEDQNWNQIWEDNFKDVDIGEQIHARAPFHPAKNVKHDIIILPKMAFGTGHHETTQLSAISLEKLSCQDKIVLDMGCGSGLLAILASQKGAKEVLAIDYDRLCVENTKENIQLNAAKNVEVLQADSVAHLTKKFDIIVSNIVKNINLRLLPEFAAKLNKDGRLILCGFIDTDLKELVKKATAYDLELTEKNIANHWLQTQFKFK